METYEVEVEDWGVIEVDAIDEESAAQKAVDNHFGEEGFTENEFAVKVRAQCGDWQFFEVWGEPCISMNSRSA